MKAKSLDFLFHDLKVLIFFPSEVRVFGVLANSIRLTTHFQNLALSNESTKLIPILVWWV